MACSAAQQRAGSWCLIPACILAFGAFAGTERAAAQVASGPLLQSEIPFDYDRGRNTSVLERERPEYEALGEQIGVFTLQARVQVGAGYSDNVYGLPNQKVGDAFVAVDPAILLESDTANHQVSLSLNGQLRRFLDETPKNETGFGGRINGRLDISRDTQVIAGAGIQRAYEQVASSGFPSDAREPVEYLASSASLRFTRSAGNLRLTGMADVRDLNFQDVRAFDDSRIDQDYRDRRDTRAIAQAEYGLTPDTGVFVQVGYTDINYDRPLSTTIANRDAHEWRALAGISMDVSAVLRGRVGAGYIHREFDAALYDNISGVALDGRIEYFPTQLTTVTLSGRRQIGEATIPGSNAFFLTGGTLRVDHELRRYLLLNAQIDYEVDDYRVITRRDNLFAVALGSNYFASRHVGLGANVSYLRRHSSGAFSASDFNEMRASVSITLQR